MSMSTEKRPAAERPAMPAGLRPQVLLETLAAFAIGVAFLGLPAGLTVGPNWLPLSTFLGSCRAPIRNMAG